MAAQYPFQPRDELTAAALDAAIGQAIAVANSALAVANDALAKVNAPKPISVTIGWPSGIVVAGDYVVTGASAYQFTILSAEASVGVSGGTITATVRNAGAIVGGLNAISITQATKTSFAATSLNAVVLVDAVVDIVITVTGAPVNAYIVLNGVH